MKANNKIKEVVDKIRNYHKKHGKYPEGNFTLTKNGAMLKSKNGKVKID
jgi:hypothetical protein